MGIEIEMHKLGLPSNKIVKYLFIILSDVRLIDKSKSWHELESSGGA